MLQALRAPDSWRSIAFISDLHLQTEQAHTFAAWQQFMQNNTADAVFILGDWFEVWVGDDDNSPFISACVATLQQASSKQALFVMHGNRDFLLGETFVGRCSATFITDPFVLDFQDERYALCHGDALCTDDVNYMAFRQMVRSEKWQQDFLNKSLPERKKIAKQLRKQSQTQHGLQAFYADVNAPAAQALMDQCQAPHLIHGHTHQAADHPMHQGMRYVLSDWDASPTASPPRAQVLILSANGLHRQALI